jgi:predicted  nucleic acid-binding Zn-ribbon protein
LDYSNHVAGFTKLFSGLVHSTVWREEMHVKVVWITMLALADRHGHVLASMPGLADASRVSLEQCEDALARLSAPDKHSRTKEHEGRRIEPVDGGWSLFNYVKYRNLRDDENRRQQVREAVSRHRAKVISVSPRKPRKAQAEAEAEAEERIERKTSAPANPLIAGRRPDIEKDGYRLIREINALEPDRDPTEILLEAAKWQTKEGGFRSKVRLETMTDDHLIRTVHDLKATLEEAKAHGTETAKRRG